MKTTSLNNANSETTPAVGIGERAGAVLFSQWNEFCRLREVALRDGDTDSIHDLRVMSRRMRAAIGLFGPYVSGRGVKRISKALRRVTRELGRLRNIDEALIYFKAPPRRFPSLVRALAAARDGELQAVTDILKPFPVQKTDTLLREAVAELAGIAPDDQALPLYLSETSIRRYQAVCDLLLPATVPENAEPRHALRIAIKKWRYLLETLGQVCRHDYSTALETLKEYQTLLGRLNDLAEFAALCDRQHLPADEREMIAAELERDTATYLAQFIETAAARPLQYYFSL